MNAFKAMKFWKARKLNQLNQGKVMGEEVKSESRRQLVNSAWADSYIAEVDDEFIINELKSRLKEHRRENFTMSIPEEISLEDGEENYGSYEEQEHVERSIWADFDAVYDKYCELMLFFDHLQGQQLRELGSYFPSTPSRKSTYKKLASPLHYLSLKKMDETGNLHQPGINPYQDLETAYVAQVCLTWEIIHCQYRQLRQKISSQPESSTTYNRSSQQFEQFQVLLQRFIENEPFEQGLRPEAYARMRKSWPILQVPKVQGSNKRKMEEGSVVLAPDLIQIIESSILCFHQFLNAEKSKSGGVSNLFGGQNHMQFQQIQSSLEKKAMKLKYQCGKTNNWKKKLRPRAPADVELLLGLMDVKLTKRVLRMDRITKEQLSWCEEKLKKLDLTSGKLQRDPSPLLFPC